MRDSAGITIVENGPLDEVATFDLVEPLIDIGTVDGPDEYLLSGAGAVLLLDDGGVVIGDRTRTIRYFAADGNYEGSFGRQGDGPGEFQFPHSIWQREDGALIVFDARHWRLTIVRDREVESTHPVRPPGMNPPESASMLADGTVVVREMVFRIPDAGFEELPIVVRSIKPGAASPDTILQTTGPRFGPVHYSDGGSIVTTPLFEPGFVVNAADDAIFTSDCDEPEFHELSARGELRGIVRWEADDRDVGPDDVEAVRRAALAEDESDEDRRRTEEYMDARPVNDRIPTCSDLRAAPGGRVWLQRFTSTRSSPQVWDVFDEGRLIGTVRLPANGFLVAIGSDRAAVLEFDALDVEHVRVYALPEAVRE